jgi:hypothetical protein
MDYIWDGKKFINNSNLNQGYYFDEKIHLFLPQKKENFQSKTNKIISSLEELGPIRFHKKEWGFINTILQTKEYLLCYNIEPFTNKLNECYNFSQIYKKDKNDNPLLKHEKQIFGKVEKIFRFVPYNQIENLFDMCYSPENMKNQKQIKKVMNNRYKKFRTNYEITKGMTISLVKIIKS